MESPVVLDKPPEYHGNNNERGFPFSEEEGGGAWSELAARHPDIAARLRPRGPHTPPATHWARKRRPDAHADPTDPTHDLEEEDFADFDRFHFDDIPPEFREHFPTHWNRRFREEPPAAAPAPPPPPPDPPLHPAEPAPAAAASPPSDQREQRSSSAPPAPAMSQQEEPGAGTVRHIPIFVEGRDEPVLSRADFAPPPPPPDRNHYYDDGPTFHPPPNFSRSFGTPFNKGYRQGPQPFVQQKVYPQTGFARSASPQRSASPHAPPPAPDHTPPQHAPPQQAPPQQAPPQPAASPPPPKPQQPSPNDPITLILGIQTDVLNLMTDVENFTGTKKDKRYIYLDEMLTRNLIKLDNIETDGKENIRLARKEAIRCIQKCIAVLEAKAEKGSAEAQAQVQDADMKEQESARVEDAATEQITKEDQEALPEAQPAAEPPPEQPPAAAPAPPGPAPAPAAPAAPQPAPADHSDAAHTSSPSKLAKKVNKRDTKKDSKDNKCSNVGDIEEKSETIQVDNKGDCKPDSQTMEVDGAASQ